MKKEQIVIFDFYLGGHHLEYLHHLYQGASLDKSHVYYFILPRGFQEKKKLFKWSHKSHIHFIFFDIDDYQIRNMGIFRKSLFLSLTLNKFVKRMTVDRIITIETNVFLPFLPVILSSDCKISTIIYSIPLYHPQHQKLKNKIKNYLQFLILSKFKCYEKIYLLNSLSKPKVYNDLYSTSKFHYLPDPYIPLSLPQNYEFHNIHLQQYTFLHFGGMTRRKGTLDILEAITYLSVDELQQYTFIFAGRIIEDIKDEFYGKLSQINSKAHILVYDRFCDYEFLAELCKLTNYIIIPYKNTLQSSGVCSYAAQFKVPVIGPDDGLLGEIIRDNGLGYTIKNINPQKIADSIRLRNLPKIKLDISLSDKYLLANSVENFNKIILE